MKITKMNKDFVESFEQSTEVNRIRNRRKDKYSTRNEFVWMFRECNNVARRNNALR